MKRMVIQTLNCLLSITLSKSQEIGVSLVADSHDTNTEELSGSGPKRDIGTRKVVHAGF